MISSKKTQTNNLGRFILLFVLLLGLLVLIVFIVTKPDRQEGKTPTPGDSISEQTLADQYGIRVNLIAVTAAGGLVDVRLKILNADKARLLLKDNSDLPILLVGERNTALTAPEDSTGQLLNSLADDSDIFLLFPNTGAALEPGMPVTVQFGTIQLEPRQAQ